ncbi:acyl carrier protein [Blastococcus sp. SYSU D00813]
MSREEVEARVAEVLALVLELPQPPAAPLVREEVPDWDSLNHVEILFAVEETFEVSFSEEEMAAFDGSAAIVDAVERHLAA